MTRRPVQLYKQDIEKDERVRDIDVTFDHQIAIICEKATDYEITGRVINIDLQ